MEQLTRDEILSIRRDIHKIYPGSVERVQKELVSTKFLAVIYKVYPELEGLHEVSAFYREMDWVYKEWVAGSTFGEIVTMLGHSKRLSDEMIALLVMCLYKTASEEREFISQQIDISGLSH